MPLSISLDIAANSGVKFTAAQSVDDSIRVLIWDGHASSFIWLNPTQALALEGELRRVRTEAAIAAIAAAGMDPELADAVGFGTGAIRSHGEHVAITEDQHAANLAIVQSFSGVGPV